MPYRVLHTAAFKQYKDQCKPTTHKQIDEYCMRDAQQTTHCHLNLRLVQFVVISVLLVPFGFLLQRGRAWKRRLPLTWRVFPRKLHRTCLPGGASRYLREVYHSQGDASSGNLPGSLCSSLCAVWPSLAELRLEWLYTKV